MSAKPARKKSKRRRKNPCFGGLSGEQVSSMMADLAIQTALAGATMIEKLRIAAFIPQLLIVLRAPEKLEIAVARQAEPSGGIAWKFSHPTPAD